MIHIQGIYKITSPSCKIYIGQSIDIVKRKYHYSKLDCKGQPILYNSFLYYGFENHIFEIIEECSLDKLNERELYYKLNVILVDGWEKCLFCQLHDEGGGVKDEIIKQKISNSLKNRKITWNAGRKPGFKHSEIDIQKISSSNKGRILSEEHKQKLRKPKKPHIRGKKIIL